MSRNGESTRRRARQIGPAVALFAVTSLAAVLVAGCAGTTGRVAVDRSTLHRSTNPVTTSTTDPPLPVDPVRWTPCGNLQCGSVTVPLDYAVPEGAAVQIAVARHPAEVPTERIGSLVINPGGPGGSGIDDLPNELSVLTLGVLDRFDIVSFDPRGVERSTPVTCSSPSSGTSSNSSSNSGGGGGGGGGGSETTGPLIDPVPTDSASRQALLRNDVSFARQCQQGSGGILPHVGTVDTARDLDRIRAALGDARLSFVGHSYGTLLGATYAELFPTHVRAMVLDGAIDPALSTVQYVTDQAMSYESELQSFFAWCATDSSCAWRPVGDPTSALLDLIQRSRSQALTMASGGTAAGPGEIYDALLAGLEAQSSWPALAGALAEAESGNGSAVTSMTGRYETGGSSNGAEAEQAIDCVDHPVDRDPSSYPALAATVGRSAPVFGPLLAWGLLGCATWPALPTRAPAPAADAGAPPIVVVGTSGDPVTPYQWAVDLARELTGASVLTWQGQSHVAYFYSPCVRAAVQAYLVDGVLPPTGTVCTD